MEHYVSGCAAETERERERVLSVTSAFHVTDYINDFLVCLSVCINTKYSQNQLLKADCTLLKHHDDDNNL